MRATIFLAAAFLCTAVGCSGLPTVTRTGDVKDIFIRENLDPLERDAGVGDEVRWINKRNGPVSIVFLQPVHDLLTCSDGLNRGFMSMFRRNDTVPLNPNETTSVCFKEPGFYRYTARMQSASPTGEINASGVLRIGNVAAPVKQPAE